MPSRRDMLMRAGLGCGMLALADLLARDGVAAPATDASNFIDPLAPREPHFPARAKRIIWLFMHGGPSQVDTFDPKTALIQHDGKGPPAELHNLKLQFTDVAKQKLMGSKMSFSKCGESGIDICDEFRHLQGCADDLCVIRSCHHDVFNHTPGIYLMNTGHHLMGRPSMGSWLTYGLGCETDNLPAYVVMNDGPLKPGAGVWSNGFLPTVHQGTNIRSGAQPIANLRPPKEMAGADQREMFEFVQSLNRQHLHSRPRDTNLEARIASYELAFRMQSAAPEAVDINREPKRTQEMYGNNTFGRHCLIARRLVERGVRMVQIYDGGGSNEWDTHGNNYKRHVGLIRRVDQGCAALLNDLKQRGMLADTLVIWSGEFGRTPTTEGNNGRDHSPYGFSIWLAGGGVRGGQVVGATDELGFRAVEDPLHIHDLHATLLHLMGIQHDRLTYFHDSRDMRLTDVHGQHGIAERITRA